MQILRGTQCLKARALMFLSYITPREEGCYYLQSTFSLLSVLENKKRKIKGKKEKEENNHPRRFPQQGTGTPRKRRVH